MRTLFLFTAVLGAALLVAISTAPAMAAGPAIEWQRLLGGTDDEKCYSADLTADGGCVLVGSATSSQSGDVAGINRGNRDVWLVKLDGAGTVAGKRLIGGSGDEQGNFVEQTADGGYVLIGDSSSSTSWDVAGTNHGNRDAWVVKMDANGAIQKQLLLGGTGADYGRCIRQTADGGYILVGDTLSPSLGDPPFAPVETHGGSDIWVARLDAVGNLLWFRLLGGGGHEYGYSVEQTADGGYVILGDSYSATITEGGTTATNHGGGDIWVVKLDPGGATQSHRMLGGASHEYGRCIRQTADLGYVLVGDSHSSESGDVTGVNHGNGDMWVVRLGPAGAMVEQRLLGGGGAEYGNSVQQTADGGYIVLGYSDSSSITEGGVTENGHGDANYDYWAVKLGPGGLTRWHDLLGSGGDDQGNSVLQTPDGGYILAGYATPESAPDGDVLGPLHGGSDPPWYSDYWVVKLAPDPPTVTGIAPASAYAGQTVGATVSGTGFNPGAEVRLVGTHGYFQATNESTNGAGTAITCTVALPSAATSGSYAVAVLNAGASTWVSRPDAFMVYTPAPTVTGISPATAARGTSVVVNISGTNFEANDHVYLRHTASDTYVGPGTVLAVTPAQIRCEIGFPGTIPVGAYDVRVMDGSTGWSTSADLPGAFHVIETMTVTGISPGAGARGTTIAVNVTGTGFIPGAEVMVIGPYVVNAVGETTYGSTRIQCTLSIPPDYQLGPQDVHVRNPGQPNSALAENAFTVLDPLTVAGISPATADAGDTFAATVSGTGFGPDAEVRLIGGTTIAATGESTNSAGTQIACTLSVPSGATAGSYAVEVRNAGMSTWVSRAAAFEVRPTVTPTPTVTMTPTVPGLAIFPGCTALPTDTDGDRLYDDANGNRRKDFADVVLYFNQMGWIPAHEPLSAFDYNGNGRIDFADVVWLFNHL